MTKVVPCLLLQFLFQASFFECTETFLAKGIAINLICNLSDKNK